MRKYYSVPLFFLFLAAGIGLFLRWQFLEPTPGVRYTYFLHAHSHVMFLGWVFNVLYLSFVDYHLPGKYVGWFTSCFFLLQALVLAMMVSFPIEGYGMYSILFTTLHTLAAIGFIIGFFRLTKGSRKVSLWLARVALLFFLFSTAGPFSLGYLMANDLGSSVWSNYSIYFYLHFQYNGFFLFGVLSLFYQLLEEKHIEFNRQRALKSGLWLAVACIPAYFLSTLFAHPGLTFNVAGALAAILQLAALVLLHLEVKRLKPALKTGFMPASYKLLQFVFFALTLKFLLQLLSAHPDIAELAYAMRPAIIAYLHLVLLGVISFFLLAWYMEMNFVEQRLATASAVVLFAGFGGSEITLVLMPWWDKVAGDHFPDPALVIFYASVLLLASTFLFLLAWLLKKDDENQFSG